jgi:hypothetical protein
MTEFVVSSVMAVLMALPNFIKLIKELMATAQTEYGQGTGPDKKTAVLNGVQAVITDETIWQKVQGIFSILIDLLAIFKTKPTA